MMIEILDFLAIVQSTVSVGIRYALQVLVSHHEMHMARIPIINALNMILDIRPFSIIC